jgi:hypothetical protein
MQPEVEWDPAKEQANIKKHGVRFAQALTALEDDYALTIEDDSPGERRFITLGRDETERLLVVVYTYRGEVVRIISARKATSAERAAYERGER